jgi:hypothetical protein
VPQSVLLMRMAALSGGNDKLLQAILEVDREEMH